MRYGDEFVDANLIFVTQKSGGKSIQGWLHSRLLETTNHSYKLAVNVMDNVIRDRDRQMNSRRALRHRVHIFWRLSDFFS